MTNFYIRKNRAVVNGIPITLMEKTPFEQTGVVQTVVQTIVHSELLGLLRNDHPQYALSSDTTSKITELSAATVSSLAELRKGIETGEINLASLSLGGASAETEIVQQESTASTFTLANIEITTDQPAPDNILAYESFNDKLIWRNIVDIIPPPYDDSDILGQIENLISDITEINYTMSGYVSSFTGNYIRTKLLHLSFQTVDGGVFSGTEGAGTNDLTTSHGIQWNNHLFNQPVGAADMRGFYSIDVGQPDGAVWDSGYTFSDVNSLAMRFSMDQTVGRGWVFARKGGGGPTNSWTPVASIGRGGQISTASGFTFATAQPRFETLSAVTDQSWDSRVLTWSSGTSAITLQSISITHTQASDMPDTSGINTDHDIRYVTQTSDAAPTVPTPYEGMLWFDTDEINTISYNVKTKTVTYTATNQDAVILCNSTLGVAFTLELPTSISVSGVPYPYHIKNIGTGVVTVSGNTGELIDGQTTQVISFQYDAIALANDGSNWYII